MSDWISVEDRLPEMSKPYESASYKESAQVLIWNGHYCQVGKYAETYTGKRVRWEADGRVTNVTHWQLLPEPPAKGGTL